MSDHVVVLAPGTVRGPQLDELVKERQMYPNENGHQLASRPGPRGGHCDPIPCAFLHGLVWEISPPHLWARSRFPKHTAAPSTAQSLPVQTPEGADGRSATC